jgi:hypothetical protein
MRVSEGLNGGALVMARVLPQRWSLRVIRTATSDCSLVLLRGLSEGCPSCAKLALVSARLP